MRRSRGGEGRGGRGRPHGVPVEQPNGPDDNSAAVENVLKAVLQTPGLSEEVLTALDLLRQQSGYLKPQNALHSNCFPVLIASLLKDYERPELLCGNDYLSSRQRCMLVRLLNEMTAWLLPHLKTIHRTDLLNLFCRSFRVCSSGSQLIPHEEKLVLLSFFSTYFQKQCEVDNNASCGDNRLGELLGYLTLLVGLHPPGREISLVPATLPHFNITIRGPHAASATHSLRTAGGDSAATTSESDFSDQDLGNDGEPISDAQLNRRKDLAVKCQALQAIGSLARYANKKEVVSFWFVFLPDESFCPLQLGISGLLEHPIKEVRLLSIGVLIDFLSHSSQFLALAQYQERDPSYTSLSSALARSLKTLHVIITDRLGGSLPLTSNKEKGALLKLLSSLVANVPYPRLEPGLVETLVESVLQVGDNKSASAFIQVSALSVFVSLLQFSSPQQFTMEQVERIFSFLYSRCLPYPSAPLPDNNICYMALQGLSHLASIDIQILVRNAVDVKKLIDNNFLESDSPIVLHTFKFVKNFVKELTAVVENESPDTHSRHENMLIAFWIDFLKPGNFQLLDKHERANMKSAFSDCLAEMGSRVFSLLPEAKQILCITYILGQCNSSAIDPEDQDMVALRSCIRVLGVFVRFPCYLTDTAFHIDMADAILTHLSSLHGEKEKGKKITMDASQKHLEKSCAWSLANLSDVLVQSAKDPNKPGDMEEFPLTMLVRILNSGITMATNNQSTDLTKTFAVRCIGNLVHIMDPDVMKREEYQNLVEKGVSAVVKNISAGKTMKVRWNACYSASIILQKPGLEHEPGKWRQELINKLMELVTNFENFKVRINAAFALGSVSSRAVFANLYLAAFKCLLDGLEAAQNVEVFGEWQHQENLVNQLCLSICHLISLAKDAQDFSKLVPAMEDQWDRLESSLRLVAKRTSPEKFSPLLAAANKVKELGPKGEQQLAVLQLLDDCANTTY